MKFEILSSEIILHGRVFELRRDHVRYPDGRTADYDIIIHAGAVTIVPIDGDGNVWFVRQYRHATGEILLELPAGTIEEGEKPEICAARELREEIGYSAGNLRQLGAFYLAPGYSNEYMYIFLATQLNQDPLETDEDEFIQTEAHPASKVIAMMENGEFNDAKTIAALSLARPYLEGILIKP